MGSPPLRECALRNNGVLQKLRKLQYNSRSLKNGENELRGEKRQFFEDLNRESR
jgi:hypothetical protein